MARLAHDECGGPGVGAVGMCFTGNFALSMTLEPSVIAPVVNHPSLPFDDPAGLELSDEDAAAIRDRFDADDLTAIGYRFDNDRWCTGQRFAAYRALLGDRFDGRVVPGNAANVEPPPFFRDVVGTPHSVVTAHLVDEEGHPTIQARDEIIAFADLGEHIRDPIKQYSSGMVVRLGFAIATALAPDILITDEVLAVGDESFQKRCIAWIERYLAGDGTLLLCSHSMYHIQKMCGHALWLKDGRVEQYGPPEEIFHRWVPFEARE